jgi:thiamine-phosphate pyrophosphorylase
MKKKIDWRLCFIADLEAVRGRDVLGLAVEAAAGGATIIQLRAKTWTGREFLRLAKELARILKPKGIPLIINDRADIAFLCQADGVHLGQDDVPVAAARKILGKKALIGVSVCTPAEAVAAEAEGADYLGAGPVFPTLSKPDLPPLLGLAGLREIRARVRIPILAIGGISASNAGEAIAAGGDGVAVISAIASAENPRRATTEIIESIDKIRLGR